MAAATDEAQQQNIPPKNPDISDVQNDTAALTDSLNSFNVHFTINLQSSHFFRRLS